MFFYLFVYELWNYQRELLLHRYLISSGSWEFLQVICDFSITIRVIKITIYYASIYFFFL